MAVSGSEGEATLSTMKKRALLEIGHVSLHQDVAEPGRLLTVAAVFCGAGLVDFN